MTTKRIDMALHIQELCARYRIRVQYQSAEEQVPNYWARPTARTIQIRPTRNTGYYVSALHEIGHVVEHDRGEAVELVTKELNAWIWARAEALVWTETANRIMRRCMDGYGWRDTHKRQWAARFPSG
jgi:hypothetical protein